jgi:hypothetical protein
MQAEPHPPAPSPHTSRGGERKDFLFPAPFPCLFFGRGRVGDGVWKKPHPPAPSPHTSRGGERKDFLFPAPFPCLFFGRGRVGDGVWKKPHPPAPSPEIRRGGGRKYSPLLLISFSVAAYFLLPLYSYEERGLGGEVA